MYSLKLFAKIVKYRFLAQIEYPGSYLLGIVFQWLSYGTWMFMLFLMIWNFGMLAGWLPAQAVFMYASWLLSYAIGAAFTFNICRSFSQMAIDGTMDEALVRPVRPFLYLLATNFNLGYISHASLALAAVVWAYFQLALQWTFLHYLWFVVMIISGAIVQACMMLLCEMPGLRLRARAPTNVLFWEVWSFLQYPITIFPRAIQFIFATILPYSFISFYPVQVLLGKQDGLFAAWFMWLSPVVAVMLVCITALNWRRTSKYYESAGT